ncbi:unnamed protein product, partial [Prorocentrum cordatum]
QPASRRRAHGHVGPAVGVGPNAAGFREPGPGALHPPRHAAAPGLRASARRTQAGGSAARRFRGLVRGREATPGGDLLAASRRREHAAVQPQRMPRLRVGAAPRGNRRPPPRAGAGGVCDPARGLDRGLPAPRRRAQRGPGAAVRRGGVHGQVRPPEGKGRRREDPPR